MLSLWRRGVHTRIQKVLANHGVASRRKVEAMIADGRIRVNGDKAKVGMKIDPDNNDSITLDGIPIHLSSSPSPTPSSSHPLLPQRMTLVVNKPGNVLSAAGSDEWGRQTVVELAMKHLKSTTSSSCNHDDDGDGDGDLSMLRLYPVGRLDLHTTGLILVTNEGELAHRIAHPKYELEKEYHAVVKGNVDQDTVRWLEQGVALNDGMTHPAKVAILDNNAAPSGGRKGKGEYDSAFADHPRGTEPDCAPDVCCCWPPVRCSPPRPHRAHPRPPSCPGSSPSSHSRRTPISPLSPPPFHLTFQPSDFPTT